MRVMHDNSGVDGEEALYFERIVVGVVASVLNGCSVGCHGIDVETVVVDGATMALAAENSAGWGW